MAGERLEAEIARLRQKIKQTRPAELHRILKRAGFIRRFRKGDHWIYRHPRRPKPLVIDPANPVKPAYVLAAIHALRATQQLNSDHS